MTLGSMRELALEVEVPVNEWQLSCYRNCNSGVSFANLVYNEWP